MDLNLPQPALVELIEGIVDRIKFVNEESGWMVAQLRILGGNATITIVGSMLGLQAGETLRIRGRWVQNTKFGRQFEVEQFETVTPSTELGIRRYLGSGMIKGIGPKMADRLVDAFGVRTLEVLEEDGKRLQRVDGIGPKRAKWILEAWKKQKAVREVMIFLQAHDVSSTYAARIYKKYGPTSIEVVQNNPYLLAQDISGVGFKTADAIAFKLGFQHDSDVRAQAGIIYTLKEFMDDGHCYCPEEDLFSRCVEKLNLPREVVLRATPDLEEEGLIVREKLGSDSAESLVFLKSLHDSEVSFAFRLDNFLKAGSTPINIDAEAALEWVQKHSAVKFSSQQQEAIRKALSHRALILTGGPGTGKTTIVRSILDILERKKLRIGLAAPTGRAAKRLSEATGRPAQTIHRLLKFDPRQMTFEFDASNPLPFDLLILDESSMVDLPLMEQLFRAVHAQARVIWVGDVDQLPSVGPGQVLADLIESGRIEVVRLTDIFRQEGEGWIVENAHRVKQGLDPEFPENAQDAFFIKREEPAEGAEIIREIVTNRIPQSFNVNPKTDIQVLTPMHRGELGSTYLNELLQSALNSGGECVQQYGRTFHRGDKVMQVRNNYDKDVFNGDIGFIVKLCSEDREIVVEFDGRPISYDFNELDELLLAYAISIHKSQGSEYPVVVIPLHTQHYVMLKRNLLYTALTRGRRLVVIVGTAKALGIAVRNSQEGEGRWTLLKERLSGA